MVVRKILTVGNSLAVSIPRGLAREWNLAPGQRLFLRRHGRGGLLITPGPPPPLDTLLERLRPHLGREVLAVALYGSFLKGGYRRGESDIDLLFVVAGKADRDLVQSATSKVEFDIGYGHIFGNLILTREELKGLWDSGDPFIKEALGGAVLHGGDALRRLLE